MDRELERVLESKARRITWPSSSGVRACAEHLEIAIDFYSVLLYNQSVMTDSIIAHTEL
jgi:hypothetical protein